MSRSEEEKMYIYGVRTFFENTLGNNIKSFLVFCPAYSSITVFLGPCARSSYFYAFHSSSGFSYIGIPAREGALHVFALLIFCSTSYKYKNQRWKEPRLG